MLMMKLKDMRMGTFKGMTALDKKAPGRRGKFFRNVSGNAVEWLGEEVATPFFGVKKKSVEASQVAFLWLGNEC